MGQTRAGEDDHQDAAAMVREAMELAGSHVADREFGDDLAGRPSGPLPALTGLPGDARERQNRAR